MTSGFGVLIAASKRASQASGREKSITVQKR
jgi:hypothetical protein